MGAYDSIFPIFMPPQVIIISGPSSSGKTTLTKALQEKLPPSIWLNFSFDTVIYSLPPNVLDRCNVKDDWSDVDGKALISGTLAALRALVDNGNRVIFDTSKRC
ncbi:chloramphenicol phosphotransferase CPT family protein [Verrucomicrobiales bacterium]|nr:chloramphenicol phosphotransferase CPT family protein [Verrucomicrobiales bacterium]MDC0314389.1 chloramphenicol phosphotransferase CPT family protein [bacterium]